MAKRSIELNLFACSLPLILIIATASLVMPTSLATWAKAFTALSFAKLDWFFLVATSGMLVLALLLAVSRFGRIVLGTGAEPEFSTLSWLAMLFAAGMGTGILFWGVAEPLTHFQSHPGFATTSPEGSAQTAMVITALHWGLHAWAIYAMSALVLAYFCFRHNRLYLPGEPIRAMFSGRWVEPVALLGDILAVLAIVFGVAGAIAMGTFEIETGLHLIFGTEEKSHWVAIAILIVLVAAYMASAATSLDRGIQWLSNINVGMAILLCVFLLIAGPTLYLLRTYVYMLYEYIRELPSLSMRLRPSDMVERNWLHGWTLTYFVWWIAWAPFVGIFIARISRGRTIREFIVGVVFVPTFFSLLWFAILGGSGLYEELSGEGGIGSAVAIDKTVGLFALFERFPMSDFLSVVAMLLVFIFMVTSVDSATFVLGMITSKGATNPPRLRKIAWGLALGVLGVALTLTRNIDVVRAIAIVGAIPFTFILLLQIYALLRALFNERDNC